MVTLVMLILAVTAGSVLSRSWLKQRQEAREAAYTRILDNHPMQYQSLIEKYASRFNLQPAYVSAIILNESSYNTRAESRVGARGLMQLMPETAQWIAHKLG